VSPAVGWTLWRRRSYGLLTMWHATTHAFVDCRARYSHAHLLFQLKAAQQLLAGELNVSGQDVAGMTMLGTTPCGTRRCTPISLFANSTAGCRTCLSQGTRWPRGFRTCFSGFGLCAARTLGGTASHPTASAETPRRQPRPPRPLPGGRGWRALLLWWLAQSCGGGSVVVWSCVVGRMLYVVLRIE
jgi:hypothetical protein